MGISLYSAHLLAQAALSGKIRGQVVTLGRQDLYLSPSELSHAAARTGYRLPDSGDGPATAEDFLMALGAESVTSLDAHDFEGADIMCDLNVPIPLELKGCFDTVLDLGTLEHVFDIPQALQNVTNMLKPGGRVIHATPVNNYVDHGYYQFSPCLLTEFYRTNGWQVEEQLLLEVPLNRRLGVRARAYLYRPGILDNFAIGKWGKRPLSLWCVARRDARAEVLTIPQQGYYQKAWSIADKVDADPQAGYMVRQRALRTFVGSLPGAAAAHQALRRRVWPWALGKPDVLFRI